MNPNLNPVQFYHGTTAKLKRGDSITPGHPPVHSVSAPDRVYFSSNRREAESWARSARGTPKLYGVEPEGGYTNDRNTSEPENYESAHPLRVTRILKARPPGRLG